MDSNPPTLPCRFIHHRGTCGIKKHREFLLQLYTFWPWKLKRKPEYPFWKVACMDQWAHTYAIFRVSVLCQIQGLVVQGNQSYGGIDHWVKSWPEVVKQQDYPIETKSKPSMYWTNLRKVNINKAGVCQCATHKWESIYSIPEYCTWTSILYIAVMNIFKNTHTCAAILY